MERSTSLDRKKEPIPKNKKSKKKTKKVQGAYLPLEDYLFIKEEARLEGTNSTALVSIVLREWCNKKRLEKAEALIESTKRRERNDQEGAGIGGSQETES